MYLVVGGLLLRSLIFYCPTRRTLQGIFSNIFRSPNENDLEVAHPQSGSLSTRFLIELEFGMLVFEESLGRPEYPEKNLSEQRREPATNSKYFENTLIEFVQTLP